jgi:hypothetical protein
MKRIKKDLELRTILTAVNRGGNAGLAVDKGRFYFRNYYATSTYLEWSSEAKSYFLYKSNRGPKDSNYISPYECVKELCEYLDYQRKWERVRTRERKDNEKQKKMSVKEYKKIQEVK